MGDTPAPLTTSKLLLAQGHVRKVRNCGTHIGRAKTYALSPNLLEQLGGSP